MSTPRSKTFPLSVPVTLSDGTTVTEVTLVRAKGKAIRKIARIKKDGASGLDEPVEMLMVISNQPEELFDEMEGEDLLMLVGVVTDFFPAPETIGKGGEASSPTAPTS